MHTSHEALILKENSRIKSLEQIRYGEEKQISPPPL